MKKTLSLIILVAITVILLTGCGSKGEQTSTETVDVPYDQFLIAEGMLEPINSMLHSFSISGEVDEVLVKNGQLVKAGQALVVLKDLSAAELALENAKADELSARQTYNDLLGAEDLALAQAQLAVANAQKDYDKKRWNQVFEDKPRESNEDVINAAKAAVTLAEDKVNDAEERYNDFVETDDSDPLKAAALSTLANARLNLKQAQLNLNNYLNPPNTQDLAISNAEVAVAKANYENTVRELEKLQNNPVSDELAMAKARLDTAEAALINAQNQLDALTLKAAIAGTVVDLTLQSGQKVTAGETAVVVADFTDWLIKTDNLTETEVTSLGTGQKASVVLDALPDKTLEGEVTYINSLFEEKRGDITYTVTILLKQTDPLMRWGMTGSVEFLK